MSTSGRRRPASAPRWWQALLVLALSAMLAGPMAGCSECEEDYDCPGARVCDRAEGVCVVFVCGRDEDCPPSQSCVRNSCAPNASTPAPDAPDALVIRPGAQ